MTITELKEILGNNELSFSTVNFSAMANIMAFVDVKLQMDKQTFDYYYEILVEDLLKSKLPKNEVEALKEQGWAFANNGKTIVLYLKHN